MVSTQSPQPEQQQQQARAPEVAQTPDERSFGRLVMGIALLHFYGALLFFGIAGAFGESDDGASAADVIGLVLLPLGRSSLDGGNSGIFWSAWLLNSILWGLVVASLVRAIQWGRVRLSAHFAGSRTS